MPFHWKTPLVRSRELQEALGADVFLKMDAHQPTASFKIRGMGHLCEALVRGGTRHLISSSGGNAGLAVAYAGARLGVPTTIFVPRRTVAWMARRIEREGARVEVVGEVWDDAHAAALQLATAPGTAYVPPFDHPLVWEGHATMMDEVIAECPKPDWVVLSVGGGGLMCGVLLGMHRIGWADVPLLAVETEGAASFAASVQADKVVTLEKIASIALTLGARRIADEAFAWTKRHRITSWVVSDRAALNACRRFADDHRTLVEPACGAALSALYDRAAPLAGARSVLVIVCGGSGVTLERLTEWDAELTP